MTLDPEKGVPPSGYSPLYLFHTIFDDFSVYLSICYEVNEIILNLQIWHLSALPDLRLLISGVFLAFNLE